MSIKGIWKRVQEAYPYQGISNDHKEAVSTIDAIIREALKNSEYRYNDFDSKGTEPSFSVHLELKTYLELKRSRLGMPESLVLHFEIEQNLEVRVQCGQLGKDPESEATLDLSDEQGKDSLLNLIKGFIEGFIKEYVRAASLEQKHRGLAGEEYPSEMAADQTEEQVAFLSQFTAFKSMINQMRKETGLSITVNNDGPAVNSSYHVHDLTFVNPEGLEWHMSFCVDQNGSRINGNPAKIIDLTQGEGIERMSTLILEGVQQGLNKQRSKKNAKAFTAENLSP